eukprot:385075_1
MFPIILNRIVAFTAFIHDLLLIGYHIYRTKPTRNSGIVSWLTIVTLLFILSYPMTVAVFSVYTYDSYRIGLPCKWRVIIYFFTYGLSKYSVYVLIIERLFVVFNASQLQFSKTYTNTIRSFFALLFLSFSLYLFIFVDGDIVENLCLSGIPFLFNASFALFDFIICISISTVFSRRMWLLLECTNSDNKTLNTYYESLIYTVKKISILSIVSCVSTPTSIIFMVLVPGGTIWTCVDTIVNSWCIILTFKKHQRLFDIICNPLSRNVSNKCLAYCACKCCKNHIITNLKQTKKIQKSTDICQESSKQNVTEMSSKTTVVSNSVE